MHQPERTCVGCRRRSPKAQLLRLVGPSGRTPAVSVLVDPQQSQPGRGAYLHRTSECLDLAIRRRALGRALRTSSLDSGQVLEAVQAHLAGASDTA